MKLKKFKEKNPKKVGIILFTISCILLICGVILYRTFAIFQVDTTQNIINGSIEDPGDIYFAFYKDGNIQKEMPRREDGYILDEQESYCGVTGKNDNNITISVDENNKIHVSGVTTSRTKCNLYFRNHYYVKIGEENHSVSTSNNSLEITKEGNILLCNQGITASENNDTITLNDITQDSICKFYNTSIEALQNVDDTPNYMLFLADETMNSELSISSNKNLTVDLNGHTFNGNFKNYGNLKIISTKEQKGKINSIDTTCMEILDVATLFVSNVIAISNSKTVLYSEKNGGLIEVVDSDFISNATYGISSIFTGNQSSINIINSNINGPHAIGGNGGNIVIDNSTITGTIHNGITVNADFKGNITIKENSKITGNLSGIKFSGYGTVILDGSTKVSPVITGTTNKGIEGSKVLLEWNYGEIFGKVASDILSTSTVTRSGTTITTKDENGMKHSYLQ